jgi:hypothetical protein
MDGVTSASLAFAMCSAARRFHELLHRTVSCTDIQTFIPPPPIRTVVPAGACAPGRATLYRRRQSERTVRYRTGQDHLATWPELTRDSASGSLEPAYVECEFRLKL